jgi:hypothetical protein
VSESNITALNEAYDEFFLSKKSSSDSKFTSDNDQDHTYTDTIDYNVDLIATDIDESQINLDVTTFV